MMFVMCILCLVKVGVGFDLEMVYEVVLAVAVDHVLEEVCL